MGEGKASPGTHAKPAGGNIAGDHNKHAGVMTIGSPKQVKAGFGRPDAAGPAHPHTGSTKE